jgi:hypothetical protein
MDALGPTRFPEYQAVIIVDNDDGRLFPLTEGCPKCLLPIANRRLLAYQLDLLSKSGALGTYGYSLLSFNDLNLLAEN